MNDNVSNAASEAPVDTLALAALAAKDNKEFVQTEEAVGAEVLKTTPTKH